ncbi:MAG: hypothetical protein BM485_16935 [Desulfobulbaceae bacterium DB1]|nr:MAG: hypothetical protein BM485_16935 [Desulfobulbaceae bacterium DB1]
MIPRFAECGFSPLRPLIFREMDGDFRGGGSTRLTSDEEIDTGNGNNWFYCRFCRARITSFSRMIEVNGSHCHVFANPHGKVFEIGCFSAAPGCVHHGTPTRECTWFTGCSWRFSLCAVCSAHLGWHYQSDLAGSFWGLVLANLVNS